MKREIILAVAVVLMTISLSSFNHGLPQQHQHDQTPGETHAELLVSGSCGMCKTRIETTAKKISGVSSANWDAEKKQLHLQFDASKTSLDNIGKAIAEVGHDNNLYKADDDVYNALPGCCQYR